MNERCKLYSSQHVAGGLTLSYADVTRWVNLVVKKRNQSYFSENVKSILYE